MCINVEWYFSFANFWLHQNRPSRKTAAWVSPQVLSGCIYVRRADARQSQATCILQTIIQAVFREEDRSAGDNALLLRSNVPCLCDNPGLPGDVCKKSQLIKNGDSRFISTHCSHLVQERVHSSHEDIQAQQNSQNSQYFRIWPMEGSVTRTPSG